MTTSPTFLPPQHGSPLPVARGVTPGSVPVAPRVTPSVPAPGAPARGGVGALAGPPSVRRAFLPYIAARARGRAMGKAAKALGSIAEARGSRWRVACSAERWNREVRAAIEGAKAAAAAAVESYLAQLGQRATP
jgi:hypothetical protein